jgi:DNA-binding transcriptional LysR family regulator
MLTTRLIQVFLTLGDTLSYTETARRLYLSHQAVSKQIARLEEVLGHRLFVRSTRLVQLTPVGELYLAYFRAQAESFAEIGLEAEKLERSQEQDLRVGFPLGIQPPPFLRALLRQFQADYGEGRVRLEWHDVDELTRLFESGSLDVVFSLDDSGLAVRQGVCRVEVAQVRMVAAVSKKHPCYGAEALSEFSGQTFFYERESSRASTYERGRSIAAILEGAGVQNAKVELVPNVQSRQTAVELGLGCCLCLDLDTLCFHPLVATYPLGTPATGLSCYWHRQEEKAIVEAFAQRVSSQVEEERKNPPL